MSTAASWSAAYYANGSSAPGAGTLAVGESEVERVDVNMRLGFASFGGHVLLDDPQRRDHPGFVGSVRLIESWTGQEPGGEASLFGDFA
jgi:hypothetical protein